MTTEKKEKKRVVSVRWKLLFYMTVFVVVILIVTWVFQIFLLGDFYRSVKREEMKNTATLLAKHAEMEDLATVAYNTAVDYSLFITVYKRNGNQFEQIAGADATGNSIPNLLHPNQLERFYIKAKQNDGAFYSRLAFGNLEVPEEDFFDFISFDNDKKIPTKNMRMIYVEVVNSSNGNEYLIFLDTSLQPLSSTVRTLNHQFLCIFGIILIAAIVMALILYRKISAPLVRMTDAAKALSKGKYDVDFAGDGYRETRELADTLNYASKELSRADHMQKELIANISHDLRTPLTLIKGYSEVMRDLPDENTPENMQVIIDEASRLSDLVNDLLDLSRMQAGARTMTVERFDLTASLREVLNRYETLLKHRGYQMDFLAETTVEVCADKGMILQVLYNLINNAINYSGEKCAITVKQQLFEKSVRISVTDTGAGISQEDLPLIWDRYYKVDKVHKRAMIGTGLGLSIVKEILEMHRANYGVESTLGKGSTFWFELPLPNNNDTQTMETVL